MTSHSELMQLYWIWCACVLSVCIPVCVCVSQCVSQCVCVSVTAYLGVQSMHQCVLRVSVGGRASVSCHGHVRRGAGQCCLREVGLCRREYIWSVQKENTWKRAQLKLEFYWVTAQCSLLTAILRRLLSVQFSQAGVNHDHHGSRLPGWTARWKVFSVLPSPPKNKTKQQQQKTTTGVGLSNFTHGWSIPQITFPPRLSDSGSNLGVLITPTSQDKCPVSPVQHVTTFQVASVVSTVCSIDSYFIYS